MSKKIQKSVSIFTSITTAVWLSGIAMLAPMAVGAAIIDGDIVSPDAEFTEGDITYYPYDVFIVKIVGTKTFKRLILNPEVFESYGHLEWGNIQTISASTVDGYITSDLVRELNDTKVYRLTPDGDVGTKGWVNMTAAEFESEGYDWDSIYVINVTDRDNYTTGSDVVVGGGGGVVSTGTLSVTLAADTPAASIAVQGAARLPFTKVNLTASGGDVIVDSLVVRRVGLANDSNFSSLDIIDGDTNLPINNTSKTFNSLHEATFNDDFTITSGTTKPIILAGNMATDLSSYGGEVPALALTGATLKGDATLNASLPLTGNTMTINNTITIGTAIIQRGAYGNATSSSIQVGKEDYTFFSFQVAAGTVEKVEFSQVKIYQEGSASLGSDLVNLELLQDGTKIADGIIASSKYVNFSFDKITLDKGQTAQFQVRADVADGSARTIDLGIYKATDLLVKGITYGYNITPTYSGTGSSAGNPVLSDNLFTISNGTLTVTRSSAVGAANIGVANDQYLGAFTFTGRGEAIDISSLTLTIASSGTGAQIEDALTGVELVDPNGNVVAGPTDITNNTLTVEWSDTFTVPVGETVYKVRGDLATGGKWTSDDKITVSFTPSAMDAIGDITGNSITASPSSAVSGNTQTVKAASLTVSRNTLPASGSIVVDQQDVNLSSWNFDASDSGEDIRVTSILWAGRGQAATNTNALTVYVDGVAQSPVNDALADDLGTPTSSFAFESPIIIAKGTSVDIELHGDKDSTASDDSENWGLTDNGGDSIIAYGVSTGNEVEEDLTEDDGPTLTSLVNGTLTIETESNPSSAIVLAGSTGNVFSNIKLTAKYEDLDLNQLIIGVIDSGSTNFSQSATGEYRDVSQVCIYQGGSYITGSSGSSCHTIPSTAQYTFNFDKGTLTVPKGGSKTLVVKADMSTINPDADNSPGTNSADVKIYLVGNAAGIKTTGNASNAEITTDTYEDYRDATSSAMILRSSKPTVTYSTTADRLGAATSLTNGDQVIFAYKITADASGGDILLFRNTFVFATSGDNMTLTNVYIKDEAGNTIGKTSVPTSYTDASTQSWDTFTFDNPDFSVDDVSEAIKITSGESKTFYVHGTVAGVGTGENLSTFMVGDPDCAVANGNPCYECYPIAHSNFALATTTDYGHGWQEPGKTTDGDLASTTSNFIWSDNYKNANISGNGAMNNATSQPMWYNGYLVPGLHNAVTSTSYVIGWSG